MKRNLYTAMETPPNEKKKLSATERRAYRNGLRARILPLVEVLPANYRERVSAKLQGLDDKRGRLRISQVKGMQIFDEEITIALEEVAREFAQEVLTATRFTL